RNSKTQRRHLRQRTPRARPNHAPAMSDEAASFYFASQTSLAPAIEPGLAAVVAARVSLARGRSFRRFLRHQTGKFLLIAMQHDSDVIDTDARRFRNLFVGEILQEKGDECLLKRIQFVDCGVQICKAIISGVFSCLPRFNRAREIGVFEMDYAVGAGGSLA